MVGGCGGDDLRERDEVQGWDPNPRQQGAFLAGRVHDDSSGEGGSQFLFVIVGQVHASTARLTAHPPKISFRFTLQGGHEA